MRRKDYKPSPVQALAEIFLPVILIGVVVLFAPVGTARFLIVEVVACLVGIVYLSYSAVKHKGVWERWGISVVDEEDGWTSGCVAIGLLYLGSLAPIGLLKLLIPTPSFGNLWGYLLWCSVQDFVFFSLILRNLEDYLPPLLAVLITGILFGLSHYPFHALMLVTGIAGLLWGYMFQQNRGLALIIASHWAMGIIILA